MIFTCSMEQSPRGEANRISDSQEIRSILCNPKVHCPIHQCPPPVPTLRISMTHREKSHNNNNNNNNTKWLKTGELELWKASKMRSLVPINIRSIFLRIPTLGTISATKADRNQKPFSINRCISCTSSRRLHAIPHSRSQQFPSRLAIKYGLSKGPPMPHYKYEPQSVVENSNYELQAYYESPIIIDRIFHNNRPEHSYTSQKHQTYT